MIIAETVIIRWLAALRADATLVAMLDGDATKILGPYSETDKELPVVTIEHVTIDAEESPTLAQDTLEVAAWGDDPDLVERLRARARDVVLAVRYADIPRLHVVLPSVTADEFMPEVESYVFWQQFRVLSVLGG